MMKPFELLYLAAEPLLIPLHKKVRKQVLQIVKSHAGTAEVLDVGGRKSHYTIGVPGRITISDLPRETETQKSLNLGINQEIIKKNYARRSNVHNVLFDDMTRSTLPDQTFDCVIAVEVLEHVEKDSLFVGEVHRVLKPNGTFLMTTPNGDFVVNTNPDHKRHYQREQLRALLATYFKDVQVDYAIKSGKFRTLGLRSWSIKHPLQTALGMTGNVINSIQSAPKSLKNRAHGTRHLIAIARKQS
jgi:SAM-dependent methyltransferase